MEHGSQNWITMIEIFWVISVSALANPIFLEKLSISQRLTELQNKDMKKLA